MNVWKRLRVGRSVQLYVTDRSKEADAAFRSLSQFQPGGLAQLGEHLPYKQGVGGSSPSSSTITLTNDLLPV